MNTRLLYIILFAQVIFAGGLLYVGRQSRANRRQDYLELTHRVTSGQASAADFERLSGHLPDGADKTAVRSLLGPPLMRANRVEYEDGKSSAPNSSVWLYYPLNAETAEAPAAPLDVAEIEKLKGPVACFVVEFNERGRASWRMGKVNHPLPADGK